MAFGARMKKLEATLESKKRTLLWLEQAKAAGGFMQYWRQCLNGPIVPFAWLDDPDAFMLYALVNEVNVSIFREVPAQKDLFWLVAAVLRQMVAARTLSPEDMHTLEGWKTVLSRLLKDTLVLQAAVEEIQGCYFEGHSILFSDSSAELERQSSSLREVARLYNGIAEALGAQPFDTAELIPRKDDINAKTSELLNLARAEALARAGDISGAVQQVYAVASPRRQLAHPEAN